jgi:hypothetical protein
LANIHRHCAGKNMHIKIGAGQTSVFVEVAGVEVAGVDVAGSRGTEVSPDKIMASTHTPSGIGVAAARQRILEAGGLFEIGPLPSGMVIRAVVPRRALVTQAGDWGQTLSTGGSGLMLCGWGRCVTPAGVFWST